MIIKKNTPKPTEPQPVIEESKPKQAEEKIDLFDLDNIDFKQRQERRRGDRRRGFRRVDDRNLISRAREEAAAIKEAAAQEGFQEGLAQAREAVSDIRNSMQSFLGAKQEVFDHIAPEILGISIEIAKKIIKRELQQDPSLILENIKEILKDLSREETKITIQTHPSQAGLLKQEVPQTAEQLGLDAKIYIVADDSVSEGGCIVTTTNGVIDATIDTQLSVICEALKEV
jgi:flagellar assembly protein FliH